MKSKIKYFQNSLFIILFILILIFSLFGNILKQFDELWNFQNVYKISNGFQLYKDANAIITPLFYYIGYILFKIFGSNILTFRLYNTLICLLYFYALYKILINLKFSKHIANLSFIVILLETITILSFGANYNVLALAFVYIGINLYLTNKSSNLKQGLLIFLIIFAKQNTGILYAVAVIIYELYLEKFSKTFFKNQFKKLFYFLIPTTILLLHLYFNNILFDFINYSFGGLFEFRNKNIFFSGAFDYILIIFASILLYIFILLKRNTILVSIINKDTFNKFTLIFIFAIFTTMLIFPIANVAHFMFIIPLHLVIILYFFDLAILEPLFSDKKFTIAINWFNLVLLSLSITILIINLVSEKTNIQFISENTSPFYGSFIDKEYVYKINKMENYILEKNKNGIDVIILAHDSAFTMISLKQSHGVYDLVFNGNLGFNGIEKIKDDINSRKNTEFLILTNESDLFKQESLEIRDYIINNLICTGQICNYSIYTK